MHPGKQRRITTVLPAALLLVMSLLTSLSSHAAALGDELILSQLGDPVEVEIAVVQWEDIDLDQLQISAGTPEVYESFGLDYLPALETLNFNLIGPNLDGEVKVLVSSRDPMQEPYLQLLLVMRWPGGSLLREYVLLFDPPRAAPPPVPAVTPQPPASSAAPVTVTQPQIAIAQEPAPAPENQSQDPNTATDVQPLEPVTAPTEQTAAETESTTSKETVTVREIDEPVAASEVDGAVAIVELQEDEPPANVAPPSIQDGGTYKVESGDNLWDIASRFGPPDADLYQILLGIYELNRGSFINGNISLLKYGVTLRLPTTADIAGIDPTTAKSLFDQRWNEGSERIEMAERGEPLPPLSSIFAPEVVRPEINPTAPFPENVEDAPAAGNVGVSGGVATGPLAPAIAGDQAQNPAVISGPVVPGQTAIPVVPLAPAVINDVNGAAPQPLAQDPATPAVATTNAGLNGTDTSLQFMREMLEAKQQQVELLEAQMSEMNTRMLEISRVTARLNSSLDEALAQRERQQESDRRNTYLLGGLVVILSIAVIAIMMMALKLAAQIRLQHDLLQSSMQNRTVASAGVSAPVVQSEPAKPLPQNVKIAKAGKYMAPKDALSVSIIEEEEEAVTHQNPAATADKNSEVSASKEELNVQLGDMDLEHPEEPDSPGSK